MKYTIYYSCSNDILRYTMPAKDEQQLSTFISMLTNEKCYGIKVVPEYEYE